MIKKIFYIFILLFSSFTFSQLSKTHYIPPITSGLSNADPIDQYIYISTPSAGDVNFTINTIGSTSVSGTVSNANPYRHTISSAGYSSFVQDPATTSRVTSDRGFIIEADSPIYVSVRLNAGNNAQAGALVSKGENALGTTFRIGTYDNQRTSPGNDYLNFFSFMATEDNTTVNLTSNNTSGLVIENFGTGQFPINNIVLNRGQSYTVAVNQIKQLVIELDDRCSC